MRCHWHSSPSYSVSGAWVSLPAHWAVPELPGWEASAGTAGMVDRAARASVAGTLVAHMEMVMNIPGMLAIVTGTAAAPGMLAASAERCPYGFPLSYFYILA